MLRFCNHLLARKVLSLDLFIDVLADCVIDTLKLIPFLLVTYLAMEALEHAAGNKVRAIVERAGHSGPIVGSALGALPQCGFSAMAATLFAGRVVTAGTLVAVILSTSDEMIPVFVAHQEDPARMGSIILVKVVFGMVVGLGLDAALRASNHLGDGNIHIHELCEREHCHCDDEEFGGERCDCCGHELHSCCDNELSEGAERVRDERGHVGHCCCREGANDGGATHEHGFACDSGHDNGNGHDHGGACDLEHACCSGHSHDHSHGHGHRHGLWGIVRCALVHTVQVTVFIFIITFVFGLIIEGVGEDAIGSVLAEHPVRATFLAALVGLIPNCGASVAISELFLDGTLACGPMIAGLLSSGGVGLLVLWRTNGNVRENLLITLLVYVAAVVAGLAAVALGILL